MAHPIVQVPLVNGNSDAVTPNKSPIKLRYGTPVFDFAQTPYAPLTAPGVKVALVVETTPTRFVQKHAEARPLQPRRRRDVAQLGHRRVEIDHLDQPPAGLAGRLYR